MVSDNFIIKNIKDNPLTWTTTFFSLILLSLNIWMTFRLIPVDKQLQTNNAQIEAIEARNKNVDPLIERFYAVEQKQKTTEGDISEIKDAIIRVDGKLDRLVESR